jgi:hypothetical protein
VFPPPQITGHDGDTPISIKKLYVWDGVWAVQKEIFGCFFNGAWQCIELPKAKVDSLLAELHQHLKKQMCLQNSLKS